MKRLIAITLVLVMVLAIVPVITSAADGDVLYTANFKGDDKFAPFKFDCAKGDDVIDVKPSDDGKSVTATYSADTAAGRSFWGGAFKGLTYGAGKKYTISMKVAVGYTTADDGKVSSGNAGVYINMPANTDPDYLKNGGDTALFGYYGAPNIRQTLSYGAGSKAVGIYKSYDSYITDVLFELDAEGFVTMDFVVDGFNVKLFINGTYFDEVDAFTSEGMQVGFALYLYNKSSSVTVKDLVVKEGATPPAGAKYPDYYKAAAPVDYSAAKAGDVLYAADFANNNTPFLHGFKASNGNKYTVTTDPAKTNYIKFENGNANAGTYYGAVVQGLNITKDTKYTTEWKVKTGSKNSGFCFAMPAGINFGQSYNIYGNFTAESMNFATEHGSTKIENVNTPGKDYVAVTDLANDADGYATFRVEMNGYKATVYYLNTEGKWISYNEINMAESFSYDRKSTYIHDGGFNVCIGFYLHNASLVAEYKDMVVYKGLLVSDPPKPTTPTPGTGDSTVAILLALVAVSAGAVLTLKKKVR